MEDPIEAALAALREKFRLSDIDHETEHLPNEREGIRINGFQLKFRRSSTAALTPRGCTTAATAAKPTRHVRFCGGTRSTSGVSLECAIVSHSLDFAVRTIACRQIASTAQPSLLRIRVSFFLISLLSQFGRADELTDPTFEQQADSDSEQEESEEDAEGDAETRTDEDEPGGLAAELVDLAESAPSTSTASCCLISL